MKSKPTPPDDLWESLAKASIELSGQLAEDKPKGAFTTKEFSAKFHCGATAAFHRIKALEEAGIVRHIKYTQITASGVSKVLPGFVKVNQ